MSSKVRGLYEHCREGKREPSYMELSSLLRSESQLLPKLFVVIDALDEYTHLDNATAKLLVELQKLLPKLQLLVTSRPHVGNVIQQHLPGAIRLKIRAHDEDMKKYLDKQIKMERFLGLLVKKSPELHEMIKQMITERAKGMSVS